MFKTIKIKVSGISNLLQNNPQSVDPFNSYSVAKKKLTSKKSKTESDLLKLKDIEVESKIFFDKELGVYIPSSWILSSIASNSFAQAKIAKQKIRGAVFTTEHKIKLVYKDMDKVKKITDIVGNENFIHKMILPQRGVRLAKYFPIFEDWSFESEVEYDSVILDAEDLKKILTYGANYNGFGDFRPTYGRAEISYE